MRICPGRTAASLLLMFSLSPLMAQALNDTQSPPAPAPPTSPALPAAAPADLTLGGYPVLRLRGSAGGLSPEQRIGVIMERLTPLLGVPNIQPSDVVVFLPSPTSRVNRYPVIYALGRRLITVDPTTVKAAGSGKTPLQMAVLWAKRLQQVLPRVNWRPPNAPEPKIPNNPPLTVTNDFAQVGGQIGLVFLRGKLVLKVRGPQQGGLTAAERADMLTARLNHLADQPEAAAPDAVQVTTLPDGTAQLALAGTPLITVTDADATAASFTQPLPLAQGWAKNLRTALAPPPVAPPPGPVAVITPPPPDAPASPTTPAPAPTDTTPPAAPVAPPPTTPGG